MPIYHDSDAHRDDDLYLFHAREKERESRRRLRTVDRNFCLWMAVIFALAVALSIVR